MSLNTLQLNSSSKIEKYVREVFVKFIKRRILWFIGYKFNCLSNLNVSELRLPKYFLTWNDIENWITNSSATFLQSQPNTTLHNSIKFLETLKIAQIAETAFFWKLPSNYPRKQ